MKKSIFVLCAVVIAIISLIFSNSAYAKEAKKPTKEQAYTFMKKGQIPQAIAIWEVITEKTADAEAEYQLATCYAVMGNMKQADERYKTAIKVDPAYGYKIGGQLWQVGKDLLNNNRFEAAATIIFAAVEYEPRLRNIIAEELYKEGERLVKQQMFGLEDNRFSIASNLSPAVRDKIVKLYTKLGDLAADEECAIFYLKAGATYPVHDERIGNRLIVIAKRFAKLAGRDNMTQLYRNAASMYLGPQAVESLLPSRIKYGKNPDGQIFNLEAGEQIDHLIEVERDDQLTVFSTKESMYKVVLENGQEFPKGTPFPNFTGGIRIIALKKSSIKLVVK